MKKSIFYRIIFLILFHSVKGLLFGQTFDLVSSYEISPNGIFTAESMYGCGISTYDYDEDGWDDLTISSYNFPTRIYKNIYGTLVLVAELDCAQNSKACIWGDIDEDGDNDLFISGYNGPSKIYTQNNGEFFDATQQFIPNFPNQKEFTGASLHDVNLDGFLDLLVFSWSSVNGNELWLNNQGESFSPFFLPGYSDQGKFSFQGAFTDLNDNFSPDLFIANDHFQGNDLIHFDYMNNEWIPLFSGELLMPGNSMSATWGDFDNDLDEDIYISNGGGLKDHLMIQDQNQTFTTNPMAVNPIDSWSANWLDFDNDGWLDLFVSTLKPADGNEYNIESANKIFKNNSGNLQPIPNNGSLFFSNTSYTNSTPDLNHDGLKDLLITEGVENEIKVLINGNQNGNHTLRFNLKGRWSNRNAVGTRYNLFTPNFNFEGYLRSGENFMTQNSQNIVIGIGEQESIDSLKIYWPSGLTETYYELDIDQYLTFFEGASMDIVSIDSVSCNNHLVHLSAAGLDSLIWSNGDPSPITSYNNNEEVQLETWLEFGHSSTIDFTLPEIPEPIFDLFINHPTCENSDNGSVYCSYYYYPENQIETIVLNQLNSGDTSIYFEFDYGCSHTEEITLEPKSRFVLDSLVLNAACTNIESMEVWAYTNLGVFNDSISPQTYFFDNLSPEGLNVTIEDELGCSILIDTIFPSIGAVSYFVTPPHCLESNEGLIQFSFLQYSDSIFVEEVTIANVSCGLNSGTLTLSNNCIYPFEIFVEPLSSFPIDINLPSQFCTDDSIQFIPNMGELNSCTWSGELAPGDWITASGAYNISFVLDDGCQYDTIINIQHVQFPSISIEQTDDFISLETINDSNAYFYCTWPDGTIGWSHSAFNTNDILVTLSSVEYGCETDLILEVTGIDDMAHDTPWIQNNGNLEYRGKNQSYCIIYNLLGQEIQRFTPLILGQQLTLPHGNVFIICTDKEKLKIFSD